MDDYKTLWNKEVVPVFSKPLAGSVPNWSSVRKAFEVRHKLAHGQDRVTRNMAEPHVASLLEGVMHLEEFCKSMGFELHRRMPIRRVQRSAANPAAE